ncbi:carboxymuconolactone decarboxylase family protein [Actinobacteria bacterium YIM 96077]|uniref:Carboxymuconolactone decarboxylase family protein n=1 Tax=Phytoactinopolyspora halophila TaxID=1981511 RepID=A0A329QPB2_9ACTN|nr:carboxymuconolactone decarboxylase family protein [Phytoactinopolyspora halophila]AYY15029.1 carboxymuconolactone decarboxylase family protein [Actinobacteria bacterium YIM 96077]RAW14205.1 carboxymuconolactone decarboxylase family protein [Phytoactinopolyspora halophila]
MARISLDPPRTLQNRLAAWYCRRRFGAEIQPTLAAGHNTKVLRTISLTELRLARWNALDPTLKALATMTSAAQIGCSWCMDFGYWENHHRGIDPAKLRDVPRWRDSDVYTDLERRVMDYTEAMTTTPPEVTDEMVTALIDDLGRAAFVELTAMVAHENFRSRINSALGLTSQGFKEQCEVPAQ